MDVNVRGAFNVISEGMRPGLLNEPGSIVYTGSMFPERGFSKGAVYSASKHAGVWLGKECSDRRWSSRDSCEHDHSVSP
jgi:NAD(P)-dependent dehydrogenase (short-subunit alcohol dehydrogenase family)